MSRFEYIFEDNKYKLINDNIVVLEAEDIAIVYSLHTDSNNVTQSAVVHKHGLTENSTEWINKARKAYIDNGFIEEANCLKMIVGKFNLEELNKIISISGYIINVDKKLSKQFSEKHH